MPFNDKRSMDKGRALHSRYNPEAEATRFIDALNLNKGISYFILIESGLDYLVPPLREKNPEAKIISLHASEAVFSDPVPEENKADASWYRSSPVSLQNFLEKEIPDVESDRIKIIEWRPGLAVYGEKYLELLSEAANFIRRADANARTANAFGRRWFKNFFRNLSIIRNCVRPYESELPVIVTGAGPSLETIIPVLREKKQKSVFSILAVSSSVAALNAGGLEPDIVISTDGGGWAMLHLVEYLRPALQKDQPKKSFLAATMNAALPSQAGENPVLVISDGSIWQNFVLEGLGIPFISMPQRGTVTASAIDLALRLSKGKVFICGADLSHNDLVTHARPYSFDRLWEEKQNRFDPYYSQAFRRSLGIKEGGSYNIYASWFSSQIEKYPKRLFSLGGNNSAFANLSVSSLILDSDHAKKPNSKPGLNNTPFKCKTLNCNENQAALGAAMLNAAMEDPIISGKLAEELSPLLCPGSASVENLKKTILSLTEPYMRQSCG